jgi:hypothetical protein
MTGDHRGRFCQQCNKHVYNLSAMSRDEAEALVARFEGRLCARFERDADGVILTDDLRAAPHLISRRVSPVAAAIVTAIIGLSGNAIAVTAGPTARAAVHAQSAKDDRAPQPQGATPSLAGVVKDQQGAVIPGAKVMLNIRDANEPIATATSDDEGAFRFASLAEGTYSVLVVSPGFTPTTVTDVVVRAGETARLDLTLVVRPFVTSGLVVLAPQPLRALHNKSELIVVAGVGRSLSVKSGVNNEMMKTELEVTSVIKGNGKQSKVTVYNWGWGEDHRFPGGLKLGDQALFFLSRRESGDGFELSDYSYSVKKLAPADLSVYVERLNELNAMTKAGPVDDAAIVEWLMRCAEQPATRWEGAYELAQSLERDADDADDADDTEASGETKAPDETVTVNSVAAGKPAQQADSTAATCSKPGEPPPFAAILSDGQKAHLLTILYSLDALTEKDMELVELAKYWKDERLLPFLIERLRRIEDNPLPVAERIVQTVAETMNDEDLKKLAEDYGNDISYADLEEEEEEATDAAALPAAASEAGDKVVDQSGDDTEEQPKDAASARQERSKKLRHFINVVEQKRAK